MTTIQIVPWYDSYPTSGEDYRVMDILGDIRENGICLDRIIGVVGLDDMYAWGNPIPIHRVYGGDSTRHGIGSKRSYGPIKWDYEGIRDYLKTLPFVGPFKEEDQNRYDHDTHKVKMGIDRLMIKYTDKQMVEVVQGITKFVADNKLKLNSRQMHDLLANHLNLKEPVPGVDTLGVEQFIAKRAYVSWLPSEPQPEETPKPKKK